MAYIDRKSTVFDLAHALGYRAALWRYRFAQAILALRHKAPPVDAYKNNTNVNALPRLLWEHQLADIGLDRAQMRALNQRFLFH